jgi:hypothetical protein
VPHESFRMTRINSRDLDLVGAGKMLPTIEVDVGNDYAVARSCEDTISRALPLLARAPRVTVYVYEGPSINFGRPTNAIFFPVAGPERVRAPLHAALHSVPGASIRYGDYR